MKKCISVLFFEKYISNNGFTNSYLNTVGMFPKSIIVPGNLKDN